MNPRVVFPKNFFNQGNYKLVMNIGVPNVKVLIAPVTILEFEVEKLTSSGSKINNVFPGVTAPILDWVINYRSSAKI